MVTGVAKLNIDLGNSETRVSTYFGKQNDGSPRFKVTTLDNTFSDIPYDKISQYISEGGYTGNSSRIFKVPREFNSMSDNPWYCNGEICNAEFPVPLKPTAQIKKFTDDVCIYAVINAIRQGIMDVAYFCGTTTDEVDVNWEIAVLLPPGDIDADAGVDENGKRVNGAAALANKIKSIRNIEFYLPRMTNEVTITKVRVLPEGHCAFVASLFERKGVLRQGREIYAKSMVLIFDIGAGTTDITMMQNGKSVISTRHSADVGGNNVYQYVNQSLKKKGITLPNSAVQKGTETGYVKSGAKRISITRDIHEAKEFVAKKLINEVNSFLESNQISPQNIEYLLVVGGGAELSNRSDIKPLSEYIVAYMRRLSPNIGLVPYPVEVVNGEERIISPRRLNILGAGIINE